MNEFIEGLQRKAKEGQSENSLYPQMNRSNISISDMQQMQTNLRVTKGWTDTAPENAKDHLLNMIGEIGEVTDIFKKKGIEKCMTDSEIRAMLVEELADVEMYFMEILNRLQISPREFSMAYVNKHLKNLGREYDKEWHKKIVDEDREKGRD